VEADGREPEALSMPYEAGWQTGRLVEALAERRQPALLIDSLSGAERGGSPKRSRIQTPCSRGGEYR